MSLNQLQNNQKQGFDYPFKPMNTTKHSYVKDSQQSGILLFQPQLQNKKEQQTSQQLYQNTQVQPYQTQNMTNISAYNNSTFQSQSSGLQNPRKQGTNSLQSLPLFQTGQKQGQKTLGKKLKILK